MSGGIMKLQKFIFAIFMTLIGTSAKAQDPLPEFLDGIYEMEIQIGDTLFKDILELHGVDAAYNMPPFKGPITGSITVPGIFTSPLTGKAQCIIWSGICAVNFEIVAHENDQDFKVIYVGTFPHQLGSPDSAPLVLIGTARLENGDLLGNFKATRHEK